MPYCHIRIWGIATALTFFFASSPLAAEEVESKDEPTRVDTAPADIGFGEYELPDEARHRAPEPIRGLVDLRDELNPLADRLIAWPSGYIPKQGTLVLSNRAVLGQRAALSIRDDLQVFGQAFLPVANQSYASFGGQFHVLEGEQWTWTMGFQGRYRRTNFQPGTADSGVGLHVVFDVIATDDTSWSAGVATHFPLHQVVEDVDFSDCDSRSQWAEGRCGTTTQTTTHLPRSGHWTSLFVGVNHFLDSSLIINLEAFTGVSQGNFLALDSALDSELSYSEERALVEQTSFKAGLGPLGIFSFGAGLTALVGPAAIQPSVYLTNYDGQARLLPHLSLALGL